MTLRQEKDFNDPHEVLTQLQDEVDLSPQLPQEPNRRMNNGVLQYFILENNQEVILDDFGLKSYLQEKSKYDSLKPKFDTTNRAVAAKIYNAYCTFDCKTALRNLPDFDTDIQFDTIQLMAAIRNIVYTGTHTQHPWKLYAQIEKLALAPTHRPNESIETYIKRHSADYDRYRDIIGWEALDAYVTTFPGYQAIDPADADGQAAFIQAARQEHQTHCLLLGIPEGRYGNYLNDLTSSYALGAHVDNYPKTTTQLREAVQLEKYQHPTRAYSEKQAKTAKPPRPDARRTLTKQDLEKDIDGVPALMFYQSKGKNERCFVCGSESHKLPQCPERSTRPKDKWFINVYNGTIKKSFWQELYKKEQHDKACKASDPNFVEQPYAFVYQQLPSPHGYFMFPEPTLPQVPTHISATGFDNQSHRSGMTMTQTQPGSVTQQYHPRIQQQLQQQHQQQQQPQYRTPFVSGYYRPQFHQTAHYYSPMAQHTQITGVSKAIVIGQVHNQLPALEDNVVYMDSGSTIRTARNKNLFHEIQPSTKPIRMATNAGESLLDKEGITPIGMTYYNEQGIANINSLSVVVDECAKANDGSYVWMDTRVDDAIHHVKPCGDIRYGRMENGLYGIKVLDNPEYCMLVTVEGNMEGHTKKARKGATLANAIRLNFMLPSSHDFEHAVRSGIIRNLPITYKDAQLANEIFGPNEAEIKGKGVRCKPHPLTDNVHGVPEDLIAKVKKVDAAVDLFQISQVKFLAWTDLTFKYRMAPHMKDKKHKTFFKALDDCLRLYNYYDFYIRSIYSDQELAPMFDLVKDTWDIQLNVSAAQEHCSYAERNIRTIKDRCRAMWHTLPFLVIPEEIIIEMVSRVCRFLNMFPAKEGLSNHYSPLQILTGEVADYRFDGLYPFCAYCLASHEANPKNTMEPRALNALYMDRIPNSKTGGHKVYDLETHEIVTRHHIRVLPMTKTVVTCIEERAYKQGQKPLKFHKRDKVKFFPHGVSTGVAGEELGYETLLAAIEAEESDEELWENEDDDTPGLVDRIDSSDDESSVSSEDSDEDC